jgi:GntR family transcriptional regulator
VYIRIDFESEKPIYSQLVDQIVEGIALGELKEGEALPTIRQMAEDIGINLHTVNKAYGILKSEGYIKLDRRKGAIISLNCQEDREIIKNKLQQELKVIIAEAYCKKINKEELVQIISDIYNNYESRGN